MRRLALLLVLGLAGAACGSSGGGAPANFAATWHITVAGEVANCSSLSSETVQIDFRRQRTGDVDTFLFDCTQGFNQFVSPNSPALVQDVYDVTITLWNNYDRPSRLSLATATITVTLVGGITQLPTFAFTPSFGRFDLAWTIVNSAGPDTCAAVGADTFEWTVTNTANANVDTFLYNCVDMAALTDDPPVPFGNYNVRARLLHGSTVLGSASASNIAMNRLTVIIPTFAFSF
ncbi:MAG TPA: hypothetical protein VKE22_13725 [Haliangiales bacterium]|nr:hypothetical protein [Haliangiales bacterium]